MQRLVFKHSEHSSRNFLPQKGRELLENLDTLEAVIHKVVNTYCVLRMKENELNAPKENGIVALTNPDYKTSSLKAINPSLCIMSQSIPEQLNVDRREFADAVNALTKFVFLKYQL
ncbi:hypothetical protein Tco_0249151, partial [Tanacetum coccineum]